MLAPVIITWVAKHPATLRGPLAVLADTQMRAEEMSQIHRLTTPLLATMSTRRFSGPLALVVRLRVDTTSKH